MGSDRCRRPSDFDNIDLSKLLKKEEVNLSESIPSLFGNFPGKGVVVCGMDSVKKSDVAILSAIKTLEDGGCSVVILEQNREDITSRYNKILDFDSEEVKQRLELGQQLDEVKYSGLTKAEAAAVISPIRTEEKIGRNSLCSCGSNKKYKNCCKK